MADLSVLVNDNFRVLAWLYDNKNENNLVKVTQQELSESIGLSRPTVNMIFSKLKESGYLVHDNTRVGRYSLTEEAVKVIEFFRKNDKK